MVLDSHLTFSPHVTRVVAQAAQSAYALKVLKSCGLPTKSLDLVYRPTMVARVIYASPCWWGDLSAANHGKLRMVGNFKQFLTGPTAGAFVPAIPFHCLICVIGQTMLSSGRFLPTPTMSSGLCFLPYDLRSIISGVALTLLLSLSGHKFTELTFCSACFFDSPMVDVALACL